MSDLSHEEVPFDFIDRVLAVIALTPWHTYQVLTKRPERMQLYFSESREKEWDKVWTNLSSSSEGRLWLSGSPSWPLPNLWLGVSVENQKWAERRIPLLLGTPATVRFVSYEPALTAVDFKKWLPRRIPCEGYCSCDRYFEYAHGQRCINDDGPCLNWAIVGGESGPKARPFDLVWMRQTLAQCRAAGVPVFYKQGGATNACSHDRKGGHFDCFPDDLKVREFPNTI